MSDTDRVTEILQAANQGDQTATSKLLPLVYAELRRLARAQMAGLPPGNTLQPTALVHEAFLRLVSTGGNDWNTRGHFFTAAAEAMRRILVEQARRKASLKRGGDRQRVDAADEDLAIDAPSTDVLALDEALERLQADDPRKAQIVMYRYFAGLNRDETASAMDISVRTVDREWRYIKARLHKELRG